MKDYNAGGYVNTSSPLHRLDSRVKLLAFVLMIAMTLLSKNAAGYIAVFSVFIISWLLSKVNIIKLISVFRRLWVVIFVIIFMNTLFFSKENAVFTLGFITPTLSGFLQGAKIAVNVVIILLFSQLLLAVTSPMELMGAISFYLAPLRWLKIPTENLSLMISVSIRFIPILSLEAQQIKKAQTARGAGFESKNPFKKATAIIPLVVPVFVSAFRKADELSQAMESRGYQGGGTVEK